MPVAAWAGGEWQCPRGSECRAEAEHQRGRSSGGYRRRDGGTTGCQRGVPSDDATNEGAPDGTALRDLALLIRVSRTEEVLTVATSDDVRHPESLPRLVVNRPTRGLHSRAHAIARRTVSLVALASARTPNRPRVATATTTSVTASEVVSGDRPVAPHPSPHHIDGTEAAIQRSHSVASKYGQPRASGHVVFNRG